MPKRTDTTSRLSETQICEINGVTQQYRRTLVMRELVRAAPDAGCTLRDALELAAIQELSRALGSADVTLAARDLVGVLADAVPAGRLDLVYDRQYKRLQVARDDGRLRELVVHGRPVTVVALEERFAEVSDAFRRVADVIGSTKRTRARAGRRGKAAGPRAMDPGGPGADGA